MKYKIINFQVPHILVEYSTDDNLHKAYLNVRIDKKLDGSLPQGKELDDYILSYAPDLTTKPDPYAGVDWSPIISKVEKNPEYEVLQKRAESQQYLQSTDWYFARLAELGTPVPDEVLQKRAEARAKLQ